jgi:hypothetical protein
LEVFKRVQKVQEHRQVSCVRTGYVLSEHQPHLLYEPGVREVLKSPLSTFVRLRQRKKELVLRTTVERLAVKISGVVVQRISHTREDLVLNENGVGIGLDQNINSVALFGNDLTFD